MARMSSRIFMALLASLALATGFVSQGRAEEKAFRLVKDHRGAEVPERFADVDLASRSLTLPSPLQG